MQEIIRNFLPPCLVIDGQRLYAYQRDIFVLDPKGSLYRQYPMTGLAHLSTQGETMYAGVNGGKGHTIQALDRKTGYVMWSFASEGRLAAPPQVCDGVVFASIVEGYVIALNAANGTLLWRSEIGFFLSTSPTVSGEMVYVAQVANRPSVTALHSKNGQIVWRTPLREETPWSLVAAEDILYLATYRQIIALRKEDGSQFWQADVEGQSRIVSAPIYSYSSETIYGCAMATRFEGRRDESVHVEREIFLYALDPLGTLLWKRRIDSLAGSQVQAFATIEGKLLLATNDGFLTAFSGSDGVLLWRYQPKYGGKLLSLAVTQDIIYLGANDGYVYGLQAHDGSLLWQTFVDQSRIVVSAFSHGEKRA